jgi:hypothetical protein
MVKHLGNGSRSSANETSMCLQGEVTISYIRACSEANARVPGRETNPLLRIGTVQSSRSQGCAQEFGQSSVNLLSEELGVLGEQMLQPMIKQWLEAVVRQGVESVRVGVT